MDNSRPYWDMARRAESDNRQFDRPIYFSYRFLALTGLFVAGFVQMLSSTLINWDAKNFVRQAAALSALVCFPIPWVVTILLFERLRRIFERIPKQQLRLKTSLLERAWVANLLFALAGYAYVMLFLVLRAFSRA